MILCGTDAMEAKGGGVTEAELSQSSKSLKAVKGREHSDSLEFDPRVAEKLSALYDKLGGDLAAIFEVCSLLHCYVSCGW